MQRGEDGRSNDRRAGLPAAATLVLLLAAGLGFPALLSAQQSTSRLTVVVDTAGRPVADAEVRSDGLLAETGRDGRATLELGPGRHQLLVWKVGFAVDTIAVTLRAARDTTVRATLSLTPEELAPIVVSATRVQMHIQDAPVRVEVLASEDVQEKSLTSPGSLTNLLVEMGGIHIQRIAPGLGGVNLRLQGLPGRYTLVLSDGLPLYGGRVPSFSLAQIPPLDLHQAEVVKGAATSLYGPFALGGVVDLVSKRPGAARTVQVDGSTRGGGDGLLWLSHRWSDRWGYTFLGGVHGQARTDVNGDGWTDLPGFRRSEVRPRVFWTGADGSSLMVTAGGTAENRRGGTVAGAVVPDGHPFPQGLDTRHLDAGASGRLVLSPGVSLGIRTAASWTRHDRTFGSDTERDRKSTAFAEATLSLTGGRHQAVLGTAVQNDRLREAPWRGFDYAFTTASVFAQDTWTPTAPLSLEASVRLDRNDRYGTFLSPRLSALGRLGGDWSLRASAGTGFFAPTPLLPEVEETGFANVDPPGRLRAERGRSASLDLSGPLGPLHVTGTVFATRVRDPVLPDPVPGSPTRFTPANAPGPIRTHGLELFGVFEHEPIAVRASYSHTAGTEYSLEEDRRIPLLLTPRNAGGVDMAYEEDEPGEAGIRVALEIYHTGVQRVEDDPYRTTTPGFTTLELLVSKQLGRFVVFADGEYLTGTRQTRWDPLLLPSPGLGGRWTTEEWAPLEGRIASLGARMDF